MDVEIIKPKLTDIWIKTKEWLYIGTEGQGGHWLNKFLKIDEIIYPEGVAKVAELADDVPFKAKVSIKSLRGKLFPKREVSSMFPKNWSLEYKKKWLGYMKIQLRKGKGLKMK